MKLVSPFTILNGAVSDVWRMHDFNYNLPKPEADKIFKWEAECLSNPTKANCKLYEV
ncbi:hypothetical protein EV06_1905 [Prochlorococcus sp. MIT 0602]|uniref:hypothetical protein n=1 Tax=unclassified Prochlorococcus TaxID=2627481 RepID=UPI000533BDF9|nr:MULTISPECIES: hypothetical protein [unclassified Prochlorococcus]KGG14842.1 hypothetical protein EV06_1905 [Prochlorococcus sp. MIT 0602]KGG15726.1 hypothetical protein EV07_1691 [Prochlorococcus sp. MIT 0603]